MPLIHSPSKKALKENIRKEIVEGNKPIKQAVAIGYAVQREAKKGAVHQIAKRNLKK